MVLGSWSAGDSTPRGLPRCSRDDLHVDREPEDAPSGRLSRGRAITGKVRRLPLVYTAALVVLYPACDHGRSLRTPTLTQVGAEFLPEGFLPASGSIADNGEFVLWDVRTAAVYRSAGAETGQLYPSPTDSSAYPVGAAVEQGSSFQVLYGGLGKVIEIDVETGKRRVVLDGISNEGLIAAVRTDGDWITAQINDEGTLRVSSLVSEQQLLQRYDVSARTTALTPVSISASNGRLLAALRETPSDVIIVGGSGAITVRPPLDSLLRVPAAGLRNWVSISALWLGPFLVHSLADLQSDRRVLITYSETGAPISWKQLVTPIGLVAASPNGRLVLAVRNLGRAEAVRYAVRY